MGQPLKIDTDRLDAIRGIAALCIFVGHIHQIFIRRFDLPTVEVATFFSVHPVAIFFVLSGFVITRSILKNVERNKRFIAADYALNRVARIYPPCVGAVAISLIAYGVIWWLQLPGSSIPFGLPGDDYAARGHLIISWSEIVSAFQMKAGLMAMDGPLWSLYIEFNIYILAMGVAMILAGRGAFRVLGFLVVIYAAKIGKEANPDFWFFTGIWCIGAALNFVRFDSIWTEAAGAVAAGVAVTIAIISPHVLYSDDLLSRVFLVISCVAYGVFLVADFGPRFHIFGRPASTAKYSYTLYIVHFPLLLLTMAFAQGFIGHSLLRTAVVVIPAGALILFFVMKIAPHLENTAFFKSLLTRAFRRQSQSIRAAAE